jgi:hypothetical protein
VPINEAALRHRLPHGITYSGRFEEFEACIAAGLRIDRWTSGGYDRALMAQVVAWHRLHSMMEAHIGDASSTQIERNAKKK